MATPDDPKAAPKPVPAPPAKKGSSDDEDDVKTPRPAAKQKMLSTGLSRAIVLATVLVILGVMINGLLGKRYELVPAPNSTNGFMYRIDKLTGAVHFCAPAQCTGIPIQNE